eukprot:UN07462
MDHHIDDPFNHLLTKVGFFGYYTFCNNLINKTPNSKSFFGKYCFKMVVGNGSILRVLVITACDNIILLVLSFKFLKIYIYEYIILL